MGNYGTGTGVFSESENIDSGGLPGTRRYIRERQHVLLLKDHVIAWLARLSELEPVR